jgi:hypothetical protein
MQAANIVNTNLHILTCPELYQKKCPILSFLITFTKLNVDNIEGLLTLNPKLQLSKNTSTVYLQVSSVPGDLSDTIQEGTIA